MRTISLNFPTHPANGAAVCQLSVAPWSRYRITHINCSITNGDGAAWDVTLAIGKTGTPNEIFTPGNSIGNGITVTQAWSVTGVTTGAATTDGQIVSQGMPHCWFNDERRVTIDCNGATTYQISDVNILIEADE